MTTITLQVPDSLGEYMHDTVRFIASKLYNGKLSWVRQLIGWIDKRTLLNY